MISNGGSSNVRGEDCTMAGAVAGLPLAVLVALVLVVGVEGVTERVKAVEWR